MNQGKLTNLALNFTLCCPDCGDDYFQCKSTHVCLHRYLRCNGKVDCADGTDETNCTDACKICEACIEVKSVCTSSF